jgi:hypothetical protein
MILETVLKATNVGPALDSVKQRVCIFACSTALHFQILWILIFCYLSHLGSGIWIHPKIVVADLSLFRPPTFR